MKKYLLLLLCAGFTMTAYADQTADQFAMEAGNISGSAQACGQDVTTLIARSKEAIKALAPLATDQASANAVFDKSVSDALANQGSVMRKLSCQDVLSAYNNLPILRSDYEKSVIAVLAADARTSTAADAHANPAPTQTQAILSAENPSETPTVTQQSPQPQSGPQQNQSQMQQALQNEMTVTPDSEQSYVAGNDTNNVMGTLTYTPPKTNLPTSDNISAGQSLSQNGANPYASSSPVQAND